MAVMAALMEMAERAVVDIKTAHYKCGLHDY
jgi:hypothetical protein